MKLRPTAKDSWGLHQAFRKSGNGGGQGGPELTMPFKDPLHGTQSLKMDRQGRDMEEDTAKTGLSPEPSMEPVPTLQILFLLPELLLF